MESRRYADVRKKVSKRLGMKHVLGHTDLSYMWDECRYQQAYHINEMSPWCAVSLFALCFFSKLPFEMI